MSPGSWRKRLSSKLAAVAGFSSLVWPAQAQATADVFVQLFQWRWPDVAAECEEFLGPRGYKAVLVTPPQEHVSLPGAPWYERYQPVSYRLESRGGSRAEFAEMVYRCRAAGVEVYVDLVINHMSGLVSEGQTRTGIAGTPFGRYRYGDLYEPRHFHRYGPDGAGEVRDWKNRREVQEANLLGLTDLDTSNPEVQKKITAYVRELLELGVTGFRIDAAKHIASRELGRILELAFAEAPLSSRAFVFQEVAEAPGEPIRASEYFENGLVTEFRFGEEVSRAFRARKLAGLARYRKRNLIPADRAVVFIDNHDTQRTSKEILTYKDGALYRLANVFMLGLPYGYPQVMSSYDFERFEQPAPGLGWVREHRFAEIAGMVEFRKRVGSDAGVADWWAGSRAQIAFSRGSRGFVVINAENQALRARFATGLPRGLYADLLGSSQTIEVDANGQTLLEIGPMKAAAFTLP